MERIALERNCWYCHKPLPLTKLLKKDLFCSSAHEEQYFADQNAAAFARMKESDPELKPAVKPPDPILAQAPPPSAAAPRPLPPPLAPNVTPAEQYPPMAELLKNDFFLAEGVSSVLVPDDPFLPVPEPQPPRHTPSRAEAELTEGALIPDRPAAHPLILAPTGAFEDLPFGDTEYDIPRDAIPQPSKLDMHPHRSAGQVPVWTGQVAGEQAISDLALGASISAELSPRISSLTAQLHTTLRSSAYSVIPPIAAVAGATQFGFAISPSFRKSEKLPGAGSAIPDVLGFAPGRIVEQAWAIRHNSSPNPVFPSHFNPPSEHWSKAGTFPGVDCSRTLEDAPVSAGWKPRSPESLRPTTIATSWTNSHNPAVAARPALDAGPQRTPQLASATPIGNPPGAVDSAVRNAPLAEGDLESRRVIRIVELQHDLTSPSLRNLAIRTGASLAARQMDDVSWALHVHSPGHSSPAPVSRAAGPRAMLPASPKLQSAARIDDARRPVPGKTFLSVVSTGNPQIRTGCRIPENNTSRPAAAAIPARTSSVRMWRWRNDSATGSEIDPLPHVPPHPASMVVAPGFTATVEAGWSSPVQSAGDPGFLTNRHSLEMPFQAVLRAPLAPSFPDSREPACAKAGPSGLPVSYVPRSAACFPLDLTLRDVAYAHAGAAQKSSL